jgi:hypothetical protein
MANFKTKAKSKAKSKEAPGDQFRRFREMAAEVGADEAPGALDRSFGKIQPKQPAKPAKPK